MTPVTGATFPTAMRRSAPCLGAERRRRTSILISADAGRARLVSSVPLRPRCRKSGSVLGWRAPDHRLTTVGLRPRGSGRLLKGVGRQPPASSPASEASGRRSRALIRPSGRSLTAARSRLAVGGQAPSPLGRSAARTSELSSQHSRALIRPRRSASWTVARSRRREANTDRTRIVGSGSAERAGSAHWRLASVPIVRPHRFDSVARRQAILPAARWHRRAAVWR